MKTLRWENISAKSVQTTAAKVSLVLCHACGQARYCFYLRDAILARVIAMEAVCMRVARMYCVKMDNMMLT